MLPSCAFLPLVVRSLQLDVRGSVIFQSTHRTQRGYHQQYMPLKGFPIDLESTLQHLDWRTLEVLDWIRREIIAVSDGNEWRWNWTKGNLSGECC